MKVILRQNVESLGQMGDLVTVKDGYARNYLIPKGLAYYASEKAIKMFEIEKKKYLKRQELERIKAENLAEKLSNVQLSIYMKVGEEGKLYGSVNNILIANELQKEGFEIDKRQILIEEPIKTLGVFDVKIKLHPQVISNIKVWVLSEEEGDTES